MLTNPRVIDRTPEPYVAIPMHGPMCELPQFAPPKFQELHRWMEERGVPSGGAGFFRYKHFDRIGNVEMEVATTTVGPAEGFGDVLSATLPGGRYLAATHIGPYPALHDAAVQLLDWAEAHALEVDRTKSSEGETFGCSVEIYRIHPMMEADPSKWETDLLIRLADAK